MARDEERRARSAEQPVVGGLPEVPGIVVAMRLAPGLSEHLKGLADALLVEPFPGSTLSRGERELIATAVSAGNDCFYCMDSHGAFASELLRREEAAGGATGGATGIETLIDGIKSGRSDGTTPRLAALLDLARTVQRNARAVTADDVGCATAAGASDGDVQLTVLIASAFCMYNRMVDGLRARTPPSAEAYRDRAAQIAEHGYSDPRVQSLPR